MTNRHPSWNRLMGFSPLLEAGFACGAGAVMVVMEHLQLKKGYRLSKRNEQVCGSDSHAPLAGAAVERM
jgi:hypothetical protein